MAENALELINSLFIENEDYANSMPLFLSSIRSQLASIYSSAKVLNSSISSIKNGELVRFRCIIQNSHGFELFASHLNVTNEKGEPQLLCGAFQNDFEATWTNPIESKSTASRYIYSVAEIPGESEWVLSNLLLQDECDNEVVEKCRKIDDKKFIVKIYEDCDDSLLPNTIVDLYGIYQSGFNGPTESELTAALPSIHVVRHEVIDSLTLVPRPANYDVENKAQLVGFLTSLLGCDVAAQYLLFSMISRTYAWRDELAFPLCSFPLNIVNVQNSQDIIGAIKMLMPMVQVIEVTREMLENEKLFPVMDHETGILSKSRLQVCRGTVLILDMTKFEVNETTINLKNNAVENIQALKALIAEQKILYDYKFYKHPLETDVITLVLSKRSWKIVETPFVVSLPNTFIDGLDPIRELKNSNSKLIDSFRYFLADARSRVQSVQIPYEFQRAVCEGFTEIRQRYNEKAPDRLKQLLVLTRLTAALDNKLEMDMTCYEKVNSFEQRRDTDLRKFLKEIL